MTQSSKDSRTEIAGFKLSPTELAELDRLIARLGFQTRSEGLRALTLGAIASAPFLLRDYEEAA